MYAKMIFGRTGGRALGGYCLRMRTGIREAIGALERMSPIVMLMISVSVGTASADEARVAVAASFLNPLQSLANAFEDATNHEIVYTSGSTGLLYAQIVNGAPFDILLAADRERPRLLAERELGDPDSVLTYAVGRLALWSGTPGRVDEQTLTRLGEESFRWFAIAEPDVAPFGRAARQVLENLGVWELLVREQRIVSGQNVAQSFAYIETGNAELGLVALSQVLAHRRGSYSIVPDAYHDPIRHDAILLNRATGNPAAVEFIGFLATPEAAMILEGFGYQVR